MDKRASKQNKLISSAQPGVRINGVAAILAIFIYLLALLGAYLLDLYRFPIWVSITYLLALFLLGTYILVALKIASQWEKAIVLRLGRFHNLSGPGLFWIIPVVDTLPNWIDHRVMVTPFSAEKTLTNDPTQLHHLQASARS